MSMDNEHASGSADAAVGIQAKVAFLQRPGSYPERPFHVQAVETHMSWVFLTDRHAYKLKKPVRYEFLDYSTLDARHRDCSEEVRLNRPLGGHVYLGVVPLTVAPDGLLRLEGEGTPVDWLVKMRRLWAAHMLDQAIRDGRVHADDVRRFAAALAEFYRGSTPVPMTDQAYRKRFEQDLYAYRRALHQFPDVLSAGEVETAVQTELRLLHHEPRLIGQRVDERRIIEAHGDLRPEHICLRPRPLFIDRPAFRQAFRLLDPADELAFLAIECEHAGAAWIGDLALEAYAQATGDQPSGRLVRFYKCYRACLRTSLALGHLTEPSGRTPQRWVRRAKAYLELASRHVPTA